MRTMIFLPPLPRMTGGLQVLLQVGGLLAAAGFEVGFVTRERAAWMESMPGGVPLGLWRGGDAPLDDPLGHDDIWLVPEGWPHALLPGLRAGARTVVYVQNWAYLLSEWPAELHPAKLPVDWLAVSRPVGWHVERVTGREAELLRPGIDTGLFCADEDSPAGYARGPRICWMPRKNKALARQIREIVTAWRARRGAEQPEWVEIQNMTQTEVAQTMRGCSIFLSTGFPEGCPLPPLEAMASGCVGVGFSGFGGWDYMRVRDEAGQGRLPQWLDPVLRTGGEHRSGNGLWVSDGDVMGAALALDEALGLAAQGGEVWQKLRQGARGTAELYSREIQRQRVLELWEQAQRGRIFMKAENNGA